MKKILFVVVTLTELSCAAYPKMVGTIYITKLEPIVVAFYEPDRGEGYRVLVPKELEKELRRLHMKRVVVEYNKVYSAWGDDQTIAVWSVKEAKEK